MTGWLGSYDWCGPWSLVRGATGMHSRALFSRFSLPLGQQEWGWVMRVNSLR